MANEPKNQKILFGSNGLKEVKEIYIGVNGEVKKVTEGYIGIGNIPKLFYKFESKLKELVYYGTITDLSQARYTLVSTSVGDYALFGWG